MFIHLGRVPSLKSSAVKQPMSTCAGNPPRAADATGHRQPPPMARRHAEFIGKLAGCHGAEGAGHFGSFWAFLAKFG